MSVSPYTGEPDGAQILVVRRGICPPAYPGVPTHICDAACGMGMFAWWRAPYLMDADGNCQFCGERI